MERPPATETEPNTDNIPKALPSSKAQEMPPSEIALQAACVSQSAAPARGGGRGLRGPDGVPCFQRPSSKSTNGFLRIVNSSAYPVAFKLKATHPRLYYVHPAFGRIESRRDLVVNVESIPLPVEPNLDRVCTHKFLVEIFAIVPKRDDPPPKLDAFEGSREHIHSQPFRLVVYGLADDLAQAEMSGYTEAMAQSTSKYWCNEREGSDMVTHGLGDHTLLRGQGLPSWEIVEEKARGASGREVCQVPSGKICTDFHPADRLPFQRPLTTSMSRSLIIKNTSAYPIAFKLETTLPELYFARLNSGRVEPQQIITTQRKPFPEQPSFDKDCKHEFRVKFAIIACEQENISAMEALRIAKENKKEVYMIRKFTHPPDDGMAPEELADSARTALPILENEVHPPTEAEENMDGTARPGGEVKEYLQGMHVCFRPSDALCFQRPLTRPISRSLIITNHNPYSIAYRLKTTNAKSYFVRPNSGKIEPGHNMHIAVERIPLALEPPLDEKCQDQFLVEITPIPTQEDLRVLTCDAYEISTDIDQSTFHKLDVNFLPEEGLTPEELAEYEAGTAHLIPDELFSIYPNSYLSFKRPLRNPLNLMRHVTLTNMSTRPMAFMTLFAAQNEQMYTARPAAARIEPGECLKIQVVRMLVEVEPTVEETYPDAFSFLGTAIHPDEENFSLSDVWAAARSNKRAIFQQKLPVLFIPQGGLAPEEELIKARGRLFDHLRDMEALEEVGGLSLVGRDETNELEGDAYAEQLSDAQKAMIRLWSRSVVPNITPEPEQPQV